MDIEHIQLCLGGTLQLSAPIVDAFFSRNTYHFAEDFMVTSVKHQYTTGIIVALYHLIYGAHQRCNIKRPDIFQRFLKAPKHFIFYALKQIKAIRIMCVECRAVQFCKLADLLDRNFIYRLFFKQLQKAVLQHLLRIAHPGVVIFHAEAPFIKYLQR